MRSEYNETLGAVVPWHVRRRSSGVPRTWSNSGTDLRHALSPALSGSSAVFENSSNGVYGPAKRIRLVSPDRNFFPRLLIQWTGREHMAIV